MSSKVQVLILKGKNVNEMSDMNKMSVHLEQMLLEKDGVELKTRQSLTDQAIKSSKFIIFCGYDCGILSEFFKALSTIESMEEDSGPIVFLYEEPGDSIYERLNYILTDGMDSGRVNPKVFKKIVDTHKYRDIIGYIDVALKQLGSSTPASVSV